MLRIGDFSKKSKTSIRTLRYYDEIDLFKPKEIDLFTGYRYYQEEQLEDLNLINQLKSVGFTLDEIKENWNHFSDEVMCKKKQELEQTLEDMNQKIREIDYLRSNIVNGRIVNHPKEKKEKRKSLY